MHNILYMGTFCLPDNNAAAHRVWNNGKLLRGLGHTVVFLGEQTDHGNGSDPGQKEIDGFTVYSRKRPSSIKEWVKYSSDISCAVGIIKKHAIDMIIAYDYNSYSLLKILIEFKNRLIICADCTEWYSSRGRKAPYNLVIAVDTFIRMRIINPRLDGIICISKYLYSFYNNKTNCVRIPPLVDRNDPIWHQDVRRRMDDKIQLICFDTPSNVTTKESVLPIVNAVSSAGTDMRLLVVGITDDEFRRKYGKQVVEDRYNRIKFYGRVPYDVSIRLVSESDYLVIWRERNRVTSAGFSTKFVEASTSGTRVITTDTGEMREYINRYNCGYLIKFPGEIEGTARANSGRKDLDKRFIFDLQNYRAELDSWIKGLEGL